MPALTVQTNVADNAITTDFLKQLSSTVAQVLGKPEGYVTVHVSGGQKLLFAGTSDPAALMELTSIGLAASQTSKASNAIMSLFEKNLNIPSSRMYCKFTNVAGNMMGWDKGTF